MSQERLVMDPVEVSEGREQLDITPIIAAAGLDSGNTVAEVYKAQGQYGEDDLDIRYSNVPMSAPLILRDLGGTALAKWRTLLESKISLWQREGGILGRYTPQGTAYATIGKASDLIVGGDLLQALGIVDANAAINLERRPGWWEPEVELSLHEEKTNPELIFTETSIKGDIPAPCRVEVIEKSGQDQKGLVCAFRSRYYSSASTAKAAYAATELGLVGEATKGTVTGAGPTGTAVSHTSLLAVWTPIVNTNLGGSTFLTHEGTYRVRARLRSPQGTAVSARLVWDVGDLVYPSENPAFTFPGGSAWYTADLGEVRLIPPPVGPHRWQGQIQARGTEGGEDINIDRVWLENTDESWSLLSAPPQASSSTETVKAWDNFNETAAGTITGKIAPLGGTWAGAGDAVGFTVDTTNKWIYREENSDASTYTGYYARLGAGTATITAAQVDSITSEPVNEIGSGVFVRYSDVNNWLMALRTFAPPYQFVTLLKRVSGTVTTLASRVTGSSVSEWRTLKISVDASGNVVVYDGSAGGALTAVVSASDSALATGGALQGGGYGIYDVDVSVVSKPTRRFDNFYVYAPSIGVPTSDAVSYASQKVQLTTEGMYRLDSGGTAYGPVSRVIGDLARLPVGGTTEISIKASRGDLDELPDSGIDDLAAKVYYRPTWLTFPG